MAVKRLEERLTEYNILETGWEINYHEVMAGGQGRVYPVKKNIGNKVLIEAIKVISIPSEGEEQQWKYKSESTIKTQITKRKEEAKKEYEMLLELKGNHVIPVRDVLEKSFDLINEGDQLGYDIIIRMDYLSSLENYLFENNFQSFSNEEIVNCGIQICTALNCLHNRNMAHRDIKPGNIFVSKVSDGNLTFYLGDFGSVKESSMGLSIGRSRTISGTELYLAPYWENTQYRIQRDLYSLGLTLFWMATGGNLPYEETNCKEIMDDEREGAYIKRRISQKELPTGDINDKIASVIKKACSVKKEDEINIVPTSYINAIQMRKALEKIKESKGQNVEKNIIKVEDECTEKVVSNLELTVSEERVKQQSVERIFTKQDYKGEQILVIGDEYTGIADYALQGTEVEELHIGEGVKIFGQKIWSKCKALRVLKVENYEMARLGDFEGCSNLEEVELPKCEVVFAETFEYMCSLKRVNLAGCKELGRRAFALCGKLENINLSECEEVGEEAFSHCDKLRSIYLPKCKRINSLVFDSCTALVDVKIELCEEIRTRSFDRCKSLKEVVMLECMSVGAFAFCDCTSLEKVVMPGLIAMDTGTFKNCVNLKLVELTECYSVDEKAFFGCKSLQSIKLPVCFYVEQEAFKQCDTLEVVDMERCESIADKAFEECICLRSIHMPHCKEVGKDVFLNCRNSAMLQDMVHLKHTERIFTKDDYKGEIVLVIGDEYTGIEDYALQGTPIVELIIGASVKTFGRNIWMNCTVLRKIEVENYPTIDSDDFEGCTYLEEVKFPNCKLIKDPAFLNKQYLLKADFPMCEEVERFAFSGCKSLEVINIPQCKKIGYSAFARCNRLKEVNIMQCKIIGIGAFEECSSLEKIDAPNNENVGDYAFIRCGNLERIDMFINQVLGVCVFAECNCLQVVNMPQCKKVGADAFRGCNSLVEVNIPMFGETGDKLKKANSSSDHQIKIWRPTNHNFKK